MLQIGVIGDSLPTSHGRELAFNVGMEIAKAGAILVCGGLGGVMEEACRGAKQAGGITLGILPGEFKNSANPYVDIVVVTGLGEARNIIVVRSCAAVIAIEGGYGTLSEIAYALRLGVPVVGLDTWEMSRGKDKIKDIIRVLQPEEAVKIAIEEANKVIL